MRRSRYVVPFVTVASLAISAGALVAQQPARPSPAAALDFEFFKTRVQPIFVAKREGHARCVACHTTASNMRLQKLPAGSTTWDDADSRKNFDAVRRMVVPGSLKSRLLLHPLATEAGGDFFHNGGKHFSSQNDREWMTLKDWVMGTKAGATGH
jgi:hypothetical protein